MFPGGDRDVEAQRRAARRLAIELGLDPLAARVLVARGIAEPQDAARFLSHELTDLPDPFRMKGMAAAVERLTRAVVQGEKIILYGDYDVDGVCSTALLSLFLDSLGVAPETYIPHRIDEGYGLNLRAVERIAREGSRLLVSLDCGIASVAEVARARELGMDVVIVDHHTVPETLPPATAVLNPHQPGCEYPTKVLCAAGVAFNLVMALRRSLRTLGWFATRREPPLKPLMDLVALATVCDVVPLTGANRILVRHGLDALGRADRPGVRALKEVAGLETEGSVSAGQVGFRLGPRINAAGRLDDASVGLQLLRTRNLAEARDLAARLDQANTERQSIERRMLEEAVAQAEERQGARGLVLWAEGWHPGVVGIVAARVVERFHKPTLVIGVQSGVGKGSARSIEGFHLVEALGECAEHLSRFGGHRHAAGVTLDSERLLDFRRAFESVAARRLREEDLEPRCRVDAVVHPEELTERAVDALAVLGPFGAGNPEPTFVAEALQAQGRLLTAKNGGTAHLKLVLPEAPALDTIGWGLGPRLAEVDGPVDLAFQPSIDTWNGRTRVSLKIRDFRAAEAAVLSRTGS
ncbi:MAG TPA: single-stranded-DNA-specific exonuclease RecJ [Myxococcaceae bacterium]|nr:single-stranded-DNA-specific exonuclease RecJ [Myxococcaceae bacterium]